MWLRRHGHLIFFYLSRLTPLPPYPHLSPLSLSLILPRLSPVDTFSSLSPSLFLRGCGVGRRLGGVRRAVGRGAGLHVHLAAHHTEGAPQVVRQHEYLRRRIYFFQQPSEEEQVPRQLPRVAPPPATPVRRSDGRGGSAATLLRAHATGVGALPAWWQVFLFFNRFVRTGYSIVRP
ncbi:hypothetical protein PVAP13_3NG136601 [Panicum virgatum]|uniref:Uncharacterized protein n=1 Tax=Panicum virgatum TaxID=38727 RepID=A0A8T0UFU1_PANVG|nr:hypothetical protein PVAP13_3NG136601 [Panicum virgatum]